MSAVVKDRSNGMKNPLASMGGVINDDEIESSAMTADPLSCMIAVRSAMALQLLLSREGSNQKSGLPPVMVRASIQASGQLSCLRTPFVRFRCNRNSPESF